MIARSINIERTVKCVPTRRPMPIYGRPTSGVESAQLTEGRNVENAQLILTFWIKEIHQSARYKRTLLLENVTLISTERIACTKYMMVQFFIKKGS